MERHDLWFLFAHGAGASSSSAWMQHYRQLLETIAPVITFDYLYMTQGKKRPDPLPRLLERHKSALHEARAAQGEKVVLIGKSMGGRIGCHLALSTPVLGVICLGYPLIGQGNRRPKRDQVLYDLKVPALFVQGTRDPLCPLHELSEVLAKRTGPSELHIVDSGDHSLQPTKTYLKNSGRTAGDLEQETLAKIAYFCSRF